MGNLDETFLGLSLEEAKSRVVQLGGRAFHAGVIRREVFERGVLDYAAMTSLSKPLRERLAAELPLLSSQEIARSEAPDGTTKLLLRLADGETVETVHMPARPRGGEARRGATLCVSTQVGCPVRCPFCASGRSGLVRNLAAHEILEQYLHGRALGPLRRSVVMGIGEPLANQTQLIAAMRQVNRDLGLGARRVTVSTVGFPDRLRRLVDELGRHPPFQLAISLHSADDDQRARLVPAMAGVPVEDVLAAGDLWFDRTGREVTFEVCLLGGENDSIGHAERLAARLARRRATVNLIPYNPVPGDRFLRPEPDAVESFRATLEAGGVVATVRWSRGLDSDAACGQLRSRIHPV
ncbi:MAG TPA: 23S rRNA (adenine(2503)-C(2))-methyltransferase RlmN [Planctomycetes bacterium]|nr:23S rRNA (adenine(2503)-C(2))-methyltransferase RlmN [Planctomycetota bacterium]